MKEMKTLTIGESQYEIVDANSRERLNTIETEGVGAGRITETNGVIFNDYENNDATGKYSAAFGSKSRATGDGSIAGGMKKDASGDYPVDENGNEIIPDEAYRSNEAIGTGSMAMGMGAVAYSRASKSFGYRTQTGYPPNAEELAKRTHYEKLATVDGEEVWVVISKEEYDTITNRNLRREVVEVETLTTKNYLSEFEYTYEGDLHTYGDEGDYLSSEVEDGTGIVTFDISSLAFAENISQGICVSLTPAIEDSTYDIIISLLDSSKAEIAVQKLENLSITDTGKNSAKFDVSRSVNYLKIECTCKEPLEGIHNFCELELRNATIECYPRENVGQAAVAIGADTRALAHQSFAGGNGTIASGHSSFAFGGNGTTASNKRAVAFGCGVTALGQDSFAANRYTEARNLASAAFGEGTRATESGQMVVGKYNVNSADMFVVGCGTSDTERKNAFTVGASGATIAAGLIIGGALTTSSASGITLSSSKVSIGSGCSAGLSHSIAGGYNAKTQSEILTSAHGAMALGNSCTAEAKGAFAGGSGHARAIYASAFGSATYADNTFSSAFGDNTITGYNGQFVIGRYNEQHKDSYFVVGKGSSAARSNAFVVDSKGNAQTAGAHTSMGADYAEMFEWQDGNPESEDRIGYVVALDGEQIRLAQSGDEILGVISGTAAVLGDSAAMNWKGKYVTDEFGRIQYDLVEEFEEEEDIETGEVIKTSLGFFNHPRLNPNYNPDEKYIPREERPEWGKVGLMGKLYTRDDGTCVVGGYATVGSNGILTNSESATNIKVMKRTNDNIVWVLLK